MAGVWLPKDEAEDYWFYNPWALSDVLLVPEETFASQIVPALNDQVYVALWYLVMDGANLRAARCRVPAGPHERRHASVRPSTCRASGSNIRRPRRW